jgi:hypothetical protein
MLSQSEQLKARIKEGLADLTEDELLAVKNEYRRIKSEIGGSHEETKQDTEPERRFSVDQDHSSARLSFN